MKVRTHCTKCGRNYRVDDRLLGRKANCKACGESFAIVADGDAPESPVLPKECADKDAPRSASGALLTQPQSPQRISEPNPVSEKVIYGLAGTAIVLFLLGNCFAYSHYWSLRKLAEKQIREFEQQSRSNSFLALNGSQRPSRDTIPKGVGIILQLSKELEIIGLLTWESDGTDDPVFVRVFRTTLDGFLTIAVYIGPITVFVSLLLIMLSVIAVLRRRSTRPRFFLPSCGIGLGVMLIVLSGVKYRSIRDRIDQDKKSVAVTSAWTFLQMELDENKRLPASIDEISGQELDIFDKLYYAGVETPDAVKKTPTERLLLAPRDCHNSNCLYLAVVMCPFNDGYTPCMRIMSGSKINDMISKAD